MVVDGRARLQYFSLQITAGLNIMESFQNNSGTAKGSFAIRNEAQPSDDIWEIPIMLVVDQGKLTIVFRVGNVRNEWLWKEVHMTRTGLENNLWDCVGYEAVLYLYY